MAKSEPKLAKPAIGLMGGTFDPVHFGHLRSALEVFEQLDLAQVRLIPCAIPPHRQQPEAGVRERRLMLELAVKAVPQLVVDDRELDREGPSYTVDTLLSLRQDFADNPLFLMLGSDAFAALESWSRWPQIIDLAHIVIMQRPQETLILSDKLAAWYQAHKAVPTDQVLPAGKIWSVPVTQLAISATRIRQAIAAGHNPRYLMPDAVIELIRQTGLYQQHG